MKTIQLHSSRIPDVKYVINIDNINCLESYRDTGNTNTIVHMGDNDKYYVKETIDEIERLIDIKTTNVLCE